MKRSIEDLKSDVALLPVAPNKEEAVSNEEQQKAEADSAWLSSALSKMGREPEDDPLPLPTINWGSEDDADPGQFGVTQAGHIDPDAWLRSAPAAVRDVVKNALKTENEEKKIIIDELVANLEDSSEKFKMRDQLEKKTLSELRGIRSLVSPSKKPAPQRNYVGAAPAVNNLSDGDKEDILPLPTMSFDKL
jgi:hypothetical protein